MAWYNGGDWVNLRADRLGCLLQELAYAVNERQVKANVTVTNWSGYGTYPAAWQFDGLRRDRAGVFLNLIRDQIEPLYRSTNNSRFIKFDGSNWTEADLLTAAGFGSSWLDPHTTHTGDIRPFLQLRNVIERLIFKMTLVYHKNISMTAGSGWSYTSSQAAWDNALASISTFTPTGDYVAGVSGRVAGRGEVKVPFLGTPYFQHSVVANVTDRIRFPSGVEMGAFSLPVEEGYNAGGGVEMDGVTINGVSYAIADVDPGVFVERFLTVGDGDNFDLPLGNTFTSGGYWYSDVTVAWDYPSMAPFPGLVIPSPEIEVTRYRAIGGWKNDPFTIPVAETNQFTYG